LEFVRSSRLFAFLSELRQAICIAVVGNEEALELLAFALKQDKTRKQETHPKTSNAT
jgi:hypothetical protein